MVKNSFSEEHRVIHAASKGKQTQQQRQSKDQPLAQRAGFRSSFGSPLAQENRFILRLLGDLRGKRVLDIGAGLGESSVYFAKRGAQVTAIDISPKMLELAQDLASQHGVSILTKVAASETESFDADSFDIVYVANTIHHTTDKHALFRNAHHYLRQGGVFVSWDPIKYNPIINIYRRMAMKVRAEDERPLGCDDVQLARQYFPNVQTRCFWIAGLIIFLKYYFVNRVHPNADRYWKRIYRETPKSLRWWRPLGWFDNVLTRLPGVRWLAWNVVLYGNKPWR